MAAGFLQNEQLKWSQGESSNISYDLASEITHCHLWFFFSHGNQFWFNMEGNYKGTNIRNQGSLVGGGAPRKLPNIPCYTSNDHCPLKQTEQGTNKEEPIDLDCLIKISLGTSWSSKLYMSPGPLHICSLSINGSRTLPEGSQGPGLILRVLFGSPISDST